MKKILLSIMFLVLMCGIALAKQPIVDTGSPNVFSVWFGHNRAQVEANNPLRRIGMLGSSGDYFQLNAAVRKGNLLGNYGDIVGVKVTHTSGYEFNLRLAPKCIFWPGMGENRQYVENLRPDGWMYDGVWTVKLEYKGTDANYHLQYRDYSMYTPYIVPSLQNATVDRLQDGSFSVSWSAQGVPESPPSNPSVGEAIFEYRVVIYDLTPENFYCADHQINGDWRGGPGWFDPATWRVYFPISLDHAGKPIRLETNALVRGLSGWVTHRSTLTTILP